MRKLAAADIPTLDCASCGRQITVEAPGAPCARLAALAMVLFGAVVFSIAAVLG